MNDGPKIHEPELIEKFESLLGQLATFIGRFLRTAAIVAVRPARVPEYAARGQLVQPRSFLTVSVLVTTRVIRLVVLAAIALFAETTSCREDSYTKQPSLRLTDYLALPTIVEVLRFTLPVVLLVSLVAWLLQKTVSQHSGKKELLAVQAFYALGLQGLIFFVLFVVGWILYALKVELSRGIGLALLSVTILWPACALAAPFLKKPNGWRPASWLEPAGKLLASTMLSSGVFITLVVLAWPLVKRDILAIQMPRRMLYFQVLRRERETSGHLKLAGVIANTSYDRMALIGDNVGLLWTDSGSQACYQGHINWNNNQSSLVVLDTAEMASFEGSFTPAPPGCSTAGSPWARIWLVDILESAGSRQLSAQWSPSDSAVSVHSRLRPGVRVRFRLKPFGLSVEGEGLRATVGF